MFHVKLSKDAKIKSSFAPESMTVEFEENSTGNCISFEYALDFETTGGEYIFLPACCYDGNRFDVLKKPYPPLFTPIEARVDMPITITDVPRLNKDGSGKIEVTTGDVSVPCVGVFSQEKKQGILLYTIQEIEGANLGLSYEKGKISITYPVMREGGIYRFPLMTDEKDCPMDFKQGQKIEVPYRLFRFPCEDMTEFYKIFFENRKCMGLDDKLPAVLPVAEQFAIQRDKFNSMNWRDKCGFYGVGTRKEPSQTWQPGWVGGGMSSYALMKLGGKLEWERGIKTLDHLFYTQAPSGFFSECCDEEGVISGMGFGISDTNNWHLIRKSADALYFIFKHFALMQERSEEIPQRFLDGTKKLADAFLHMWKKYGQFGQFVNLLSGDIVAGGSTSGGIAPAALLSAYKFFGDADYLEAAKQSGELYYSRDALKGYTTGGPGEILQGPDSESAFGLLESMVVLYEATGEEKWLGYAKHVAHLCSSWVVSYNYKFPKTSEFHRLNMKTVGSVFANVQNKHSAPGICTLSGDSLMKLYRWTKNERYLKLIEEISLTISQYMSTYKRTIYSWDLPTALPLPSGFICERVNMSDWETQRCVGGVFSGSCWPETSLLLTLAELTMGEGALMK